MTTLNIHQSGWIGAGDIALSQDNDKGQNTIILFDADIAEIIKVRYALKDFTLDDLVDALRRWEAAQPVVTARSVWPGE